MERNATFDFGERFAQLTALFEDAAGLAVSGQSALKTDGQIRETVSSLGRIVTEAQLVLEEIDEEL